MAHKHSVYDTDTHFSINPATRELKNEASTKTCVIQYDHNSERFTFEIPRTVEEHDMSLCNVVQVHYLNINPQTKEQKAGVYEVDDLQISPEDENVVILSWLISQNATRLVGSLNFLIRFACVSDDGNVDYVWNTAIYSKISVSSGINNTGTVVDECADILEQWREKLFGSPSEYGIPVLYMNGDTSTMSKDNKVTLDYAFGNHSGVLTCKWQGSSSLAYPKKNYTVEFDTPFEAKDGWGNQKKYCLKANWVDPSNMRNLLGAKIWGKMVKNRNGADARLVNLPNGGAIDGFQIWVVINGQPQGIYTMTIPKDAWLFGMTGAAGEGFVCAEICTLNGSVVGDGTDVKVEYAADSNALIASLNNMIAKVNAVQSADDLTALEAVVDINSVIDYYVLMATLCHTDGISRNYILGTYDGVKWFMSAYDMDATFGNNPEGTKLGWSNDWPMFTGVTGTNNLLDVVKTYYMPQIRERYQTLRYWQLAEVDLQHDIYTMQLEIPLTAHIEDVRLWPSRPGTGANTIDQIQNWLRVRFTSLDYNVTVS